MSNTTTSGTSNQVVRSLQTCSFIVLDLELLLLQFKLGKRVHTLIGLKTFGHAWYHTTFGYEYLILYGLKLFIPETGLDFLTNLLANDVSHLPFFLTFLPRISRQEYDTFSDCPEDNSLSVVLWIESLVALVDFVLINIFLHTFSWPSGQWFYIVAYPLHYIWGFGNLFQRNGYWMWWHGRQDYLSQIFLWVLKVVYWWNCLWNSSRIDDSLFSLLSPSKSFSSIQWRSENECLLNIFQSKIVSYKELMENMESRSSRLFLCVNS